MLHLRTGPAEVRQATLNEHETGRVTLPFSELISSSKNSDAAIRMASASCLARDPSLDHGVEVVAALVAAFVRETDTDVRHHIVELLPREAELRRRRERDGPR